jgi:hypothetical protein
MTQAPPAPVCLHCGSVLEAHEYHPTDPKSWHCADPRCAECCFWLLSDGTVMDKALAGFCPMRSSPWPPSDTEYLHSLEPPV